MQQTQDKILSPEVIEGFCNAVLRKSFDNPSPIPEFHIDLWKYCCSTSRYVALACPRGFGKSTAVTHTYTLASLLFREKDYAIIVSDTVTQAIQFLGDIKKELADNDDIRELFGLVFPFDKDTEDDVIVSFSDGKKFRIQAKGAEQKLRGLKWANKRPNLVIVDDLENDEAVANKDRREKLKRWFNGALLPCISDTGIVRMVGTILHLDSLLESLMPENQLKTSEAMKKKFLRQDELKEWSDHRTPWKSAKYKAHNANFSALLWEERWPAWKLKEEREKYIQQGMSDLYAQEYLNTPLDESNTFFKKSDFLPIREEDRKKRLNYYITCDLAISQRDRADYTVFAVGGVDEDGRLQCVNVVRERLDASQIIDTMLALHRTYKPHLFGVEAGTIQKAIGPSLNDAMVREGTYLNLVLLKPSTDKVTRARSIQARMRVGGAKFDKQADWYPAFENELMRFPRDKHDDQVDAWSYMGLMLDKMTEAQTDEEIEDEEYQEELEEANAANERSKYTGY
jgi:predicted phage terminase large subunit-like protein